MCQTNLELLLCSIEFSYKYAISFKNSFRLRLQYFLVSDKEAVPEHGSCRSGIWFLTNWKFLFIFLKNYFILSLLICFVAGIRIPWSMTDISLIRRLFGQSFRDRKPPDYATIRRCQQLHPSLARRTEAQIKSRVWDLVLKEDLWTCNWKFWILDH